MKRIILVKLIVVAIVLYAVTASYSNINTSVISMLGPVGVTWVPHVPIDIKPPSCPNPFNPGRRGVLSVAIGGGADFDVSMIDAVSVRLTEYDGMPLVNEVAPVRSSYEDVATPAPGWHDGADCNECSDAGPDGYTDLVLKFEVQDIVQALVLSGGIGVFTDGQKMGLAFEGVLHDGQVIKGSDCIVIRLNMNTSRPWTRSRL
jgi:hypothetical protein